MNTLTKLAVAIATLGAPLAFGGAASAQLTPWGAEVAGNTDGSIPAWRGDAGVTTIAGSKIVDPFPGDKPLFTIDASNYAQYEANLSAGQIALLKAYPDSYKIPVYQTRRIFDLPGWAQDAIAKEAGTVSLQGDAGLTGLDKSHTPFPQPKNGLEAVWNHITRYRASTAVRNYYQIPVQENGAYTAQKLTDQIVFRAALAETPDNENTLLKFVQVFKAPAQLEGNVLLVHDFIDQVKQPRAAWLYNPGQRRVRRAPSIAYDGPANGAEGLRTTDDFDMFNGSPDKYTWKLLGKREMFVPANGYRLAAAASVDDIVGAHNINTDYTRYEKRRVWVVEATLKPSERNIYSRRVFYMDEDGWSIVMKDLYDSRDNLWRYGEMHSCYFTGAKSNWNCAEPVYDLQLRRWLMLSAMAGYDKQISLDVEIDQGLLTPSALRRLGRK